jgi:hypothetical protein
MRALLLAIALVAVLAPTASAQEGPPPIFGQFLPLGITIGEGTSRIGTDFSFLALAGLTTLAVVDQDRDGEIDPLDDFASDFPAPFPVGAVARKLDENEDLVQLGIGGATFVNDLLKGDLKDRSGPLVCLNGSGNRAMFGIADRQRSGRIAYRVFYVEDNASPQGTPQRAFGVRELDGPRPDRLTGVTTRFTKPPLDCGRSMPRRGSGGAISDGDVQVLSREDGTLGIGII